GNPVSTAVGLRFFASVVLRRFLGLADEAPLRAALAEAVDKPEGLRCFFKARLEAGAVRALPGQASFQVSPLVEANGWVVFPEAGGRVKAGAEVDVYPSFPMDPAFPAPALKAKPRKGARA
ncbi:MAG: hypothetical protein HY925_04760, partial [Elusimicrobia bacterium]|nr:hypothetical protein [Elusimicrobiota bacterium]